MRFCVFHGGELSELLAQQLATQATERGHAVELALLTSFERWLEAHVDDSACVMVVTTVDGGPCALSDVCMRFLRRATHTTETLRGVRYATLGLGDSNQMGAMWRSSSWASAADCNQAGRQMDDWLAFLGGTRIVRRGEADERTDCEQVQPWIDGFLAALDALPRAPCQPNANACESSADASSDACSQQKLAEHASTQVEPSGDAAAPTSDASTKASWRIRMALPPLAAAALLGCAVLLWRRGRT